jgi:ADP-heptose:LPS heptosyltransferase
MAAEIKKSFPDAHITFAARNYTAPIPQNCSYIDEVIVFPEGIQKTPAGRILPVIRSKNFDTVFVVSPDYPVSLLMFLAKIPQRIGNGYRWFSFLYNYRIRDHRSKVKFHELEYNLRMLQGIGIQASVTPDSVTYGLTVPREAGKAVSKLFRELCLPANHPIIIVHPGSGGSAVDLPAEKFNELIHSIENENLGTVLVTGSANEADLCARVCTGTKAINLSGQFSLSELMGIIEKSDIFVSNSTGTLHIAAALGKQVIGFYPKIKVCSAKRWGPYSAKSTLFEPAIDCKNCTRKKCQQLQCMNTIAIASVTKKIKEICSDELNLGENNGPI